MRIEIYINWRVGLNMWDVTRWATGRVIASHRARAIRVTAQFREQMALLRRLKSINEQINPGSVGYFGIPNSSHVLLIKIDELSHISIEVSVMRLVRKDPNRLPLEWQRTTCAVTSKMRAILENMSSVTDMRENGSSSPSVPLTGGEDWQLFR